MLYDWSVITGINLPYQLQLRTRRTVYPSGHTAQMLLFFLFVDF